MSDNPFKIIKPTDQPPEDLKKDVMGSVKAIVLILRFVQLFVGDYADLMFDQFKASGRSTDDNAQSKDENNDETKN